MLDQEVSFGGFRGTTFSFLFSLGRYGLISVTQSIRGRDGLYYSGTLSTDESLRVEEKKKR